MYSLCSFHLVSCSVLLETIKSQCHVSIPQFEYRNHLALASVRLSLVLTLTPALLNSCYYFRPRSSRNSEPCSRISEPPSEISRLQQKVGTVHKLKPTSRHLHLASLRWSPVQTPNSKFWIPNYPPMTCVVPWSCLGDYSLNHCIRPPLSHGGDIQQVYSRRPKPARFSST